jgi:hypothetical protein
MKNYIYKLCNYTFDIIGFVFLGILVWVIISALQVSLCDAQTIKSTNLNLFVFSQNQKNKTQNDAEMATDEDDDYYYYDEEDDEENDEIIKC